MCGWTSGLFYFTWLKATAILNLKEIDYCNSGDSKYGNKDEVVGYNAIALTEKNSGTRTSKKSIRMKLHSAKKKRNN